jgi:hypothetical protein
MTSYSQAPPKSEQFLGFKMPMTQAKRNPASHKPLIRLVLAFFTGLCLINSALSAEDPTAQNRSARLRPNFEGSWEKDFGRSDKWEVEVQRTIDQLNREMERSQGRGDGGSIGISNPRRGAGNLISHARLAELITRQTTMRIVQTATEVRIERPGDAALICSTKNSDEDSFNSPHGTEYCGWDRQQLVFQISLADGVLIEHRFSVDPSGESLSMLTSVSSRNSLPFNLISFYNSYDAPEDGIHCVQTLSRGRVCSALNPEEATR